MQLRTQIDTADSALPPGRTAQPRHKPRGWRKAGLGGLPVWHDPHLLALAAPSPYSWLLLLGGPGRVCQACAGDTCLRACVRGPIATLVVVIPCTLPRCARLLLIGAEDLDRVGAAALPVFGLAACPPAAASCHQI